MQQNTELKELYAKVNGINYSDGMINILVTAEDGEKMNLKAELSIQSSIVINYVYKFKIAFKVNSERNTAYVLELSDLKTLNYKELDLVYRKFYASAPNDIQLLEDRVYSYIQKIENKIIYDITKNLVDKNKESFFVYPAATKLHHAYVGGLAFHTIGMLKIIDSFVEIYPFLNKDYLYAGAILHDLGKIIEFSGVENSEYTNNGQLLGHLVIGSQMVNSMAKELSYENTEEAMLLQHIIISHHGQPTFGSVKKPMTSEALLLWYVDTIDSKFVVLADEMEKVKEGTFSEPINVLDRVKFYKAKK